MSKRVLWVVEYFSDGQWSPLVLRVCHTRRQARREQAVLCSKTRIRKYIPAD